jgi:hypothetical protein
MPYKKGRGGGRRQKERRKKSTLVMGLKPTLSKEKV